MKKSNISRFLLNAFVSVLTILLCAFFFTNGSRKAIEKNAIKKEIKGLPKSALYFHNVFHIQEELLTANTLSADQTKTPLLSLAYMYDFYNGITQKERAGLLEKAPELASLMDCVHQDSQKYIEVLKLNKQHKESDAEILKINEIARKYNVELNPKSWEDMLPNKNIKEISLEDFNYIIRYDSTQLNGMYDTIHERSVILYNFICDDENLLKFLPILETEIFREESFFRWRIALLEKLSREFWSLKESVNGKDEMCDSLLLILEKALYNPKLSSRAFELVCYADEIDAVAHSKRIALDSSFPPSARYKALIYLFKNEASSFEEVALVLEKEQKLHPYIKHTIKTLKSMGKSL